MLGQSLPHHRYPQLYEKKVKEKSLSATCVGKGIFLQHSMVKERLISPENMQVTVLFCSVCEKDQIPAFI